MNSIKYEIELYEPMCVWLEQKLKDKFRNQRCTIIVEDVHSVYLDSVLHKYDIISYYPHIVGLGIQIDVLGIVKWKHKAELYFIEAKKTPLNLHDLGQLWAYCRLCDPEDAFLLSSSGLGSLNKVLNNLARTDLLDFGDGKKIKNMKVAKWDVIRKTVDNNSLVPKI